MVAEGVISQREAVLRVDAEQLDQLLHPVIDPGARAEQIAVGLPASPGAASGQAVFDPDVAEQRAAEGIRVILVRDETTPEDFHGIVAARAVLTARGGMTSHAAVVARGMGKCAIVGCKEMEVDLQHRSFKVNGTTINEGDWITLDGATGRVFSGDLPTIPSDVVRVLSGQMRGSDSRVYVTYARLLSLGRRSAHAAGARERRHAAGRARRAATSAPRGSGSVAPSTCSSRAIASPAMREMIVARDEGGRRRALAKLLPMQRADFEGIFEAMDGCPVTIRLLDPPLHEFLPHGGEDTKRLARTLGLAREELNRIVESLRETNPMLGLRGCRLGIVYPEITEMQGRAIFEAAVRAKRRGIDVQPEIMIPLVSTVKELENQRAILEHVARSGDGRDGRGAAVHHRHDDRAAARRTHGRRDRRRPRTSSPSARTTSRRRRSASAATTRGVFCPCTSRRGSSRTIRSACSMSRASASSCKYAVTEGRRVRPNMKTGICGEHGGEPRSIAFCQSAGLNYVSCSPYRVPIARLAAAQAALRLAQ